jgi:hypothetical protein
MQRNWFSVAVKYEKTAEEGKIVKAVENYLVDALSFTEAEARINTEMKPFISGEFIVSKVRRARINELFTTNMSDKIYSAKVMFISLDEDKGVEKRTPSKMITRASDIEDAFKSINEGMKGTMADYEIYSITETNFIDIYEYVAPEKVEEKSDD